MSDTIATPHSPTDARSSGRLLALALWFLIGATLLSIEVSVWHWTRAYNAWENRWQDWIFHVPFAKAALIGRIDTYVHILVAGSATAWLCWTRTLWIPRAPWWLPSVAMVVVASSDEFIQRYVPGRTAEWHDLICSMTGIAVVTLAAAIVVRTARRRRAIPAGQR